MPSHEEQGEPTVHVIGGRKFSFQELTWGQLRWLYQRLKGYPIYALKEEQLMELFAEELSGILAIILVEQGHTKAEKVNAGRAGLTELELWFDAFMTPTDAAPVLRDFFDSGLLIKTIRDVTTMVPRGELTGLIMPSPSSPTGT